jgi:2'-5' RNA ligase
MRLFVAVELPDAVVNAAAAASARVRDRVRGQAPRARITWVEHDRMHLTLRFLGEVDPGMAKRVQEVLAPPLSTASVAVSVGALGVFPPRGAPRVIWIGLDRGADGLMSAEREITGRLEEVGIPPELRPFSPHLTLARVREPQGLRAGPLLEGITPSGASGLVDAITLFESRLSPKGPAYTALQRTPLRRVP